MFRMIKRAQFKLARVGAKTKGAVVAVGATVGATASQAAGITLTEGTGFSGSIDSVYYLTAAGIVVSFLGIALAVTMGIRALKRA